VERMPHGSHVSPGRVPARRLLAGSFLTRAGVVSGLVALSTLAVCGGVAGAAGAAPAAPSRSATSLPTLLAEANSMSNQIDNLSEQYDGLNIQLGEARSELGIARETEQRDQRLLAAGETTISQIAAEGYMTGGVSPTLQLLQGSSPQNVLNRASIIQQLAQENGDKLSLVSAAQAAASRAQLAAQQEESQATRLSAAMRAKVAAIQAKEDVLNSAVFAQAMSVFQKTGSYPDIQVTGDSVGVQALRYALTRIGYPYVWGAAGPTSFDCSGLVVWAYAQIGISLPHYTGDLWNSGEHISRSELEPGDLVFFFPDIGHVGIYVGNGMMVDAPTFGQNVQVQPVFWSAYVGAVRIVG
jgi:peptidoglycan DL-endopeptidase CwlO